MFRLIFKWIDSIWEGIKSFFRLLAPCRFSIIVLLFVGAIFILSDQGQDVLRAMMEAQNYSVWQIILFYIALTLWAINSWYWARVMLRFKFENSSNDYKTIRTCIPRMLGVLPFVIIAYAFYKINPTQISSCYFTIATLILGVMFFAFLVIRVPLLERLSKALMQKNGASKLAQLFNTKSIQSPYESFSNIALGTWLMLAIFALIAVVLFFTFLSSMKASVFLGTAVIVFFAASSWVAFGSVLVYIGTRFSFPIMTLLLAFAIVFSGSNDNHKIRYLTKEAKAQQSVKENFTKWAHRFDNKGVKSPYFIIAAEGGGIRAAYITGLFLSELQDSNSSFGKHLYAISGVSGGSLGAAAFVAMLHKSYKESQGQNAVLRCRLGGSSESAQHSFSSCVKELFSEDFLSPAVAYMLYPDLVQRFLPKPIERFDRSLALEHSWELAWSKVFSISDKNESNIFSKGFLNLWKMQSEAKSLNLPNLFLNSTWVETGKRVITSNLAIDKNIFSDSEGLLQLLQRDIPLSTAVHNSARFTYVSPAGRVVIPDSNKTWGHLVDGGYFENSGASTAYNILKEVMDANRTDMTPVVLVITNDPSIKEPCSSTSGGCKPSEFMNETISPIRALLATRSARASYARSEIKSYVESKKGLYLEVGLCKSKEPLPLGWTLSNRAEKNINKQLQNYLDEATKRVGAKNFDPLNIKHLKVLRNIFERGCVN